MFLLMTFRDYIIPGPLQPSSRTSFPGCRQSAEKEPPNPKKSGPANPDLHGAAGNKEKLKQAPVDVGVGERKQEGKEGREEGEKKSLGTCLEEQGSVQAVKGGGVACLA